MRFCESPADPFIVAKSVKPDTTSRPPGWETYGGGQNVPLQSDAPGGCGNSQNVWPMAVGVVFARNAATALSDLRRTKTMSLVSIGALIGVALLAIDLLTAPRYEPS